MRELFFPDMTPFSIKLSMHINGILMHNFYSSILVVKQLTTSQIILLMLSFIFSSFLPRILVLSRSVNHYANTVVTLVFADIQFRNTCNV